MTSHNDDTNLNKMTVTDTTITRQNELIVQLMQQIVDMRKEINETQELAKLAITVNLPSPDDRRSPFHQIILQHHPRFQNPTLARRHRPYHHRVPLRPYADRKPPRVFTPLAESQTELFERLSARGLIQPSPPKAMADPHFIRSNQICAYHANALGHSTDDCISLKHKIQDLLDCGIIVLRTAAPNVNNNHLPDHKGNMTDMVEGVEDYHTTESSTSKHHEG